MSAIQDTYYVTSWQVFFICVLLFQGLSNIAVCILRYRLKLEGAGRIALQQFKWIRMSPICTKLINDLLIISILLGFLLRSLIQNRLFLARPLVLNQR